MKDTSVGKHRLKKKSAKEITDHFSNCMEYYRKKKGLSLNKLATESGVSPALLSRINNGTRKAPTLDKVWNIAVVLDMPLNEVFMENEENEQTR